MNTHESAKASIPERLGGKTVKTGLKVTTAALPREGEGWVKVVEGGTGPEGPAAPSTGRRAKESTPSLSAPAPRPFRSALEVMNAELKYAGHGLTGHEGTLGKPCIRVKYPCSCLEWTRGNFVTLAIDCEGHGDMVTTFEDDLPAMEQASDVLSGRLKL